MSNENTKQNASGRFIGKGIGMDHNVKPICAGFPPDTDYIIRAQKNRSEFIRQAIAEKIERERLTVENPISKKDERT